MATLSSVQTMSRLHVVVLLSLFFFTLVAAKTITDHNCTFVAEKDEIKYDHFATSCDNIEPDEVCEVLYPKGVVANTTDERPDNCFKKSGTANELMKQTAIKTCPKSCGYCCLTPEYRCENVEFPRYDCNKVTAQMCKEPKWRQIMAEDCPNVCGLCSDRGCVDSVIGCSKDPTICRQIDMQAFVKVNCRKTCGYCGNSPGIAATVCGDSSPGCKKWMDNGFCQSNFYSHTEKSRYCGISCGLCS